MTDGQLLACEASGWNGGPGLCRWCDGPLEGKRRRWCSDECSWAFTSNHMWSAASRAARKRDDNACVQCGASETLERVGHGWSAGLRSSLQVHHRTPVLGAHSVFGCHHHLAGLVTLCKPCHLVEHHGSKEPPLAQPEQLTIEVAA